MRSTPFHSLRGILALWVLFGHLLLVERYGGIYNAGFATHADLGALGLLSILHFTAVDLFFMLSGLVLMLRYGDRFTHATKGREIDRFYLHRLVRIWPLHAAMVGLVGIVHLAGIAHPITSGNEQVIFEHWRWTLGVNLLLMNGWGMIPVASWNEPAWTLSVTFLLYVLFPNLALLARWIAARRAAAVAIVLLVMLYAVQRHYYPLGSYSDGAGAIIRGVVFFSCGLLLAHVRPLMRPRSIALAWAAFTFAVLVWIYVTPFPLMLIHLTYPLLLLALLSARRRFVPVPLALWLGDRSFAIFLTHYPVLLLVRHFMGGALQEWSAEGGILKIGCYILVIGICLLAADGAARLDRALHRTRTS